MSIPQLRKAKSTMVLRSQASSRTLKAPALSNLGSIPPTPSLSSAVSTRSTSTTSSGLRTPPQQSTRPSFNSSPKVQKASLAISDRLQMVTSELESYVEEHDNDEDYVHVAVRMKPCSGVEREAWTADPVRGFIGSKLGDFYFGTRHRSF
jgi:hypothetical protein